MAGFELAQVSTQSLHTVQAENVCRGNSVAVMSPGRKAGALGWKGECHVPCNSSPGPSAGQCAAGMS